MTVESDYYTFMNFDTVANKHGRSHFVQFFDAGPVLELACGRGEFLDLLAEVDIPAIGTDLDPGMVAAARERGHDVSLADAVEDLAGRPDESLGGLFCAHFLEHLPSERVEQVYLEAARVLRPGGTFVAVVPNAGSLSVIGYDFWRDPTHVRPYDPMVLSFFADRAGLTVAESGGNPLIDPGPPTGLLPLDADPVHSIAEELERVRERVRAVHTTPRSRRTLGDLVRRRRHVPRPDPDLTPAAEPWLQLEGLIEHLDSSIQALQHHLYDLRTSYVHALKQLYPPNEVYVVARKPAQVDGHG